MNKQKSIKVSKDGPYIVSGSVPLSKQTIGVDENGQSQEWIEGETIEAGKPIRFAVVVPR